MYCKREQRRVQPAVSLIYSQSQPEETVRCSGERCKQDITDWAKLSLVGPRNIVMSIRTAHPERTVYEILHFFAMASRQPECRVIGLLPIPPYHHAAR
jgi:hypothetical protein